MSADGGVRPREAAGAKFLRARVFEADDRFGAAGFLKRNLNKVFPDHWSFMLGEIALYSFVILLLSGTYLALFFKPSMLDVTYHGSYAPLDGVTMSQAYKSTLDLSFDVRGGLLMRQVHHWAALVFIAAIIAHLCRIYFTGAFRKPREINWLIGVVLLILAILEGFTGYSLPDDLLSGTGLRIAYGLCEAIPVIGTYLAFFIFGGQWPGIPDFIPRLFIIHVLIVPGLLLALISAHMMIMWHQKHTQWAGKHRSNMNVIGSPFYPAFMAKTLAFFCMVFGAIAGLSTFFQINPVWLYGPYNPLQISAGSQPDFYIAWLEGTMRIMPRWEINFAHRYTLSLNALIPGVIVPGLLFTLVAVYPFIESWVTKDKREHHVCDRPRNKPGRTGIGVAAIVFVTVALLAGGNDLISHEFHISLYATTWLFRVLIIIGPIIGFWAARRICLGLQQRDSHTAHHGYETGRVVRLATGEFTEGELPLPEERILRMDLGEQQKPAPPRPAIVDDRGVRRLRAHVPAEMLRRGLERVLFEPADETDPDEGSGEPPDEDRPKELTPG